MIKEETFGECHNMLQMSVVCPFEGCIGGDMVPVKPFFNTSLYGDTAMSEKYEIILFVHERLRCTLLEDRVSMSP